MKKIYKKYTKKQLWEIIQSQTEQILELKNKLDKYEVKEIVNNVDKLLGVVNNDRQRI